jgi:hypothetical protein
MGTRQTVDVPAISPLSNVQSSGVPQLPMAPGEWPRTRQTLRPHGASEHGTLLAAPNWHTGICNASQFTALVVDTDAPPVPWNAVLAPPEAAPPFAVGVDALDAVHPPKARPPVAVAFVVEPPRVTAPPSLFTVVSTGNDPPSLGSASSKLDDSDEHPTRSTNKPTN